MPYFGTLVIISGLLGFWQEGEASNATLKVLGINAVKATVLIDIGSKLKEKIMLLFLSLFAYL